MYNLADFHSAMHSHTYMYIHRRALGIQSSNVILRMHWTIETLNIGFPVLCSYKAVP